MKVTPLLGWLWLKRGAIIAMLVVLVLVPQIFSAFITSEVATQALVFGIAAASLVFLNSVAGMVSLGQTALYGIAAYTTAELSVVSGVDPWAAAVIAVVITVAIGVLFGAVISRSSGIYFLMITLAFGVIANSFFSEVTTFGGHEGINTVVPPQLLGDPFVNPSGLYYAALIASVGVYALILFIRRTPFGYALQGVRDEPVRMKSLGYNVSLLRTLAFGFAAFIAAIGGVLFVWFNGAISPDSIDVTRTIDLLTIAVIGGLVRLEGAWIGALIFTVVLTYSPQYTERFETLIGLVFLAVVLLSPGGIAGVVASGDRWVRRRLGKVAEATVPTGEPKL